MSKNWEIKIKYKQEAEWTNSDLSKSIAKKQQIPVIFQEDPGLDGSLAHGFNSTCLTFLSLYS